jgi:hypothetical protein
MPASKAMKPSLPLLAEIERRLNALGYYLDRDVTDSMGRTWAYKTAPMRSGSIGYCHTKAELLHYVEQVEQLRRWDFELQIRPEALAL